MRKRKKRWQNKNGTTMVFNCISESDVILTFCMPLASKAYKIKSVAPSSLSQNYFVPKFSLNVAFRNVF